MATAGRQSVAPGEIVASQWGNTVWDQSVQCFDTAADRDAQYPAPHEGAVSFLADARRLFTYLSGAWVPFAGGGFGPQASGMATLALPTAQQPSSVAVTFPAGRFTTAPTVTLTRVTSVSFSSMPITYWPSGIAATGFVLNGVSAAVGGAAGIGWVATSAP